MAEDVIKHDTLIEDGVFNPTIENSKELLAVLQQLIDGFKQLSAAAGGNVKIGSPKTIDEAQKANETLQKQQQILKGLTDTEKQKLVVDEKIRQLQKANKDEAKAQLSAYAALLLEYRKAVQLAKDLGAQYGLTNKQFQEAAIHANTLGNNLKAIDASVGQFQRNVGNYNNQLGVLSRTLRGFGGLGEIVAGAFGIDTTGVQSVLAGLIQAGRAVKDLNHIKEGANRITEEGTAITEANTAGQYENTLATEAQGTATVALTAEQEALTGATAGATAAFTAFDIALAATGIGALIIAAGLLIEYLVDVREEERKLKEQQELNAQFEENQIFYSQQKITQLQAELELQKEKYATANASIKAETTLLKAQLKQTDDLYKKESELLFQRKAALKSQIQNPPADISQKDFDALLIQLQELEGQITLLDQQQKTKRKELQEKYNDTIKKLQFDLYDTQIKVLQSSYEKQLATIQINLKKQLDLYKGNTKEEIEIRRQLSINANKELADVTTARYLEQEKLLRNIVLTEENRTLKQELDAKISYLQIERDIEINNAEGNEIAIKNIRAKYRKQEKEELQKYRSGIDNVNSIIANAGLQRLKNNNASPEKIREAEKKTAVEDYIKQENSIVGVDEEAMAKRLQIHEDFVAKMKKIDSDYYESQIAQIQTVTDAVFDGLDKRTAYQKEVNQSQLDNLNTQLQQQTQLYVNGLDNTLAATEKKRAEALEQQAQLEKKAQREKQARELADLFLKFMVVNADKGPAAAAESLAEVLGAKAIASAIAGSFKEGVEDFKGKGTGTSDSNLVRISAGESVVTAAATSETPGLVSMLNKDGMEGAEKWMLQNIMPQIKVVATRQEQLQEAQMNLLMKELIKTVKDKRENTWVYDAKGELTDYVTREDGIQRTVNIQQTPIYPRKKPFAN